jgi:hypothetical protein
LGGKQGIGLPKGLRENKKTKPWHPNPP